MSKKKRTGIKAAIIGCGDIAGGYDEKSNDKGTYSHAGAYQACGVPIIAAMDVRTQRLRKFATFWEVPNIFHDLSDLLSYNQYDFISVCTPDDTHYPIIKEVLLKRPPKIIWAEKPLAVKPNEAKELVEIAQKKKVGLRVTYHRRWEPEHKKLKLFIEKGKLGKITSAVGYYVKGLIHVGTTVIDTLRFLIGEVKQSWSLPSQNKGPFPDSPSTGLIMQFENGCQALVQGIDGDQYTYSLFELDIIGTHGRIRILDNGDVFEVYELVPYRHYEGFSELKLKERSETKMLQAMKYGLDLMLESIENGTWEDVSEGENAVKNIEIASLAQPVGTRH